MEYPNQMTKQESKKLFIEYKKTGDKEIRDRLIENFLYIPKLLVKKYAYRSNDVEDIYQVACLGLMYAVERYDPDRGFEFDTFASPTIIGEKNIIVTNSGLSGFREGFRSSTARLTGRRQPWSISS